MLDKAGEKAEFSHQPYLLANVSPITWEISASLVAKYDTICANHCPSLGQR